MTQGDFNQTGNSLDLAIQGQGFFQVSHAGRNDCLYARRAAFT